METGRPSSVKGRRVGSELEGGGASFGAGDCVPVGE